MMHRFELHLATGFRSHQADQGRDPDLPFFTNGLNKKRVIRFLRGVKLEAAAPSNLKGRASIASYRAAIKDCQAAQSTSGRDMRRAGKKFDSEDKQIGPFMPLWHQLMRKSGLKGNEHCELARSAFGNAQVRRCVALNE